MADGQEFQESPIQSPDQIIEAVHGENPDLSVYRNQNGGGEC